MPSCLHFFLALNLTSFSLLSCLLFFSFSSFLIQRSADRTIKVWRYTTGDLVKTIENAHDDDVSCLAADGDVAVSGSFDTTVKVWDLVGGYVTQTLTAHSAAISAVAISGTVRINGDRHKRAVFLIPMR